MFDGNVDDSKLSSAEEGGLDVASGTSGSAVVTYGQSPYIASALSLTPSRPHRDSPRQLGSNYGSTTQRNRIRGNSQ